MTSLEAVAEILGFYRNYHSLRWVGDRLVIRLQAQADARPRWPPCREEFAGICLARWHRGPPRAAARPRYAKATTSTWPRIALRFDRTVARPPAPADRRSQCPARALPRRRPASRSHRSQRAWQLSRATGPTSPCPCGVTLRCRLGAGPALLVGHGGQHTLSTSAELAS